MGGGARCDRYTRLTLADWEVRHRLRAVVIFDDELVGDIGVCPV